MSDRDTISNVVSRWEILRDEVVALKATLREEKIERERALAQLESLVHSKHDNVGRELHTIRNAVQGHTLSLAVTIGIDGKNGRLGQVEKEQLALWTKLRDLKAAYFKLSLLVVGALGGGASAGIAIAKLLGPML